MTPLEARMFGVVTRAPPTYTLASVREESVAAAARGLRRLAAERRLAIGGSGARSSALDRLGMERLAGDPVGEAERIPAAAPAR